MYALNDREHATVLAALRYWQREGLMSGGHEQDVSTNGGAVAQLSTHEIDALCERLNCTATAPAAPVDFYENAARAKGWVCDGDNGGFIFHLPTWGSWKAAASWSGDDERTAGMTGPTSVYDSWRECCEGEDIEIASA